MCGQDLGNQHDSIGASRWQKQPELRGGERKVQGCLGNEKKSPLNGTEPSGGTEAWWGSQLYHKGHPCQGKELAHNPGSTETSWWLHFPK